ncbi:hypothetical protein [Lentzea sp. NPDC003310]|uniref:hypothetical protein n=1 Tax=Lentzea sp. NPDC003310 TaxID=3154447 RepID=UPI0033AA988E
MWVPWERAEGFSGRSWLFEAILDWVESVDRTLVIVGVPGSGKSAIAVQAAHSNLGQAHALGTRLPEGWLAATHFCDSYRSETLDPALFVRSVIRQFSVSVPGFAEAIRSTAVDLAGGPTLNLAASVTIGEVQHGATVIGAAVDLHGYTPGETISRLFGEALRSLNLSARPIVLVDGIDETAAFPTEVTIADLLTGPTFQDVPVRLLLTSRPAGYHRTTDVRVIDLDASCSSGQADVREYARWRLAARVPSRDLDLLADSVAAASNGNFLYAHHAIDELLESDHAHPCAVPELPGDLSQVYRGFLRRSIAITGSDGRKQRWRTALRPVLALLAVAQGDGLTRQQLHAITGLDSDVLNDALEDLSQFLHFGDTAVRVFHNSFREHLTSGRGGELPIVDARAAHHKIATAALAAVQAAPDGWERADSYTRRYLAVHARQAGVLVDLLAEVGFLVFAEPHGLVTAIESLDEIPAAGLAYRQVFPELLAHDDAGTRLSYLDLAMHLHALDEHLGRLADLAIRRQWSCRWSRARPSLHRRMLHGHEHPVTAVTAAHIAGTLVVVSGDNDGHVLVWNPVSGALLRRCRAHEAAIVGLSVVLLDEGPVLISGAKDCTLRKWDLDTLQLLGRFASELDVSAGDSRDSLLTADGTVLMRDSVTSEAEGPVAHRFAMSAVRGVQTPDRSWVVTAGEDAAVRVWDAESTDAVLEFGGFPQEVAAADVAAVQDEVIIATASHLDVSVWNLKTRQGYLVSRAFPANVRTLALLRVGDDLALLTPGQGTGAALWNIRTGALIRELPAPSPVTKLTGTAAEPGRSHLVGALADGRIRVWIDESAEVRDLFGHNSAIGAMEAVDADGRPVIVSGGADRSVRIWDPRIGSGSAPVEAMTHVWALSRAELEGRPVLTASSIVGSVTVHDLVSGEELHRFQGNANEVYRSSLAVSDRGPALVAAGDDGQVRVWDVRTGGLVHRFAGRRCLNKWLGIGHAGGRSVAFFVTGDGIAGVDVGSGALIHELQLPTSRFTAVAVLSTSSDTFVVVLEGDTLLVWGTGSRSVFQIDAGALPATQLAVAGQDGRLVVVLGYPDGHVETWDEETGRHTSFTGHAVEMVTMSAAYVGADLVVATSAGSRDVHVSMSGVLQEIRMSGDVRDVAVDPSGAVAIGTADGVTCIDLTAQNFGAVKRSTATVVDLQATTPARTDGNLFDPRGTDLVMGIAEDYGHTAVVTGSVLVLLQRYLDEAIERHGPHHPDVARALIRIARQLLDEDKTDDALSALNDALTVADACAMPAVEAVEILGLSAAVHRRAGDLGASLEALRRIAAIHRGSSAHAAPLGETLTRVVEVLIEADRPEEARTTMPQALSALTLAFGANHEELSKSLHRAASASFYRDDVQGAFFYVRQALALDDRRAPSGDRQTRESLLYLAWLVEQTEDGGEEALVLTERALTVSRRVYDANSEQVLSVLGLLTKRLFHCGGAERAAEVTGELVTVSETLHGPESMDTAFALNSYGVALLNAGDAHSARSALERAAWLLDGSEEADEQAAQAVRANLTTVIRELERPPAPQ